MHTLRPLAPVLLSALFISLLALAGVTFDQHTHNAPGLMTVCAQGVYQAEHLGAPPPDLNDLPDPANEHIINARNIEARGYMDDRKVVTTDFAIASPISTFIAIESLPPQKVVTFTDFTYTEDLLPGVEFVSYTSQPAVTNIYHKNYFDPTHSTILSEVWPTVFEYTDDFNYYTVTKHVTETETVIAEGTPPSGVVADGTSVEFSTYTTYVPCVTTDVVDAFVFCTPLTVESGTATETVFETVTVTSTVYEDKTEEATQV